MNNCVKNLMVSPGDAHIAQHRKADSQFHSRCEESGSNKPVKHGIIDIKLIYQISLLQVLRSVSLHELSDITGPATSQL